MSTNSMKRILIIGAGFLQSFLIKKAVDLGYETFCVDRDDSAPGFGYASGGKTINIVDAEKCAAYAKELDVDGVLTAATDYGVITASHIARDLGLPGLNMEAALTVKNKFAVRKRLFENHVDDTEQAFEISCEADAEKIKESLLYPVMVKPCDGSGSRGASKVENMDSLISACNNAIRSSLTGRALIESFVDGSEYGVEAFVYNGEASVLAVIKKWMTEPPYYAELGHALPCGLPVKTESRIREAAVKAIKALDINFGAVNMDVLLTGSGSVHIVDIGARMGGNLIGSHIIPAGTGIDYMSNIIRASAGDSIDLTPKSKPAAIATKLLALEPGEITALPDFDKIEKKHGVRIYHHLKLGDIINIYRTNLDGCGYITASHGTAEESEKAAEAARRQIDAEIKRKRELSDV